MNVRSERPGRALQHPDRILAWAALGAKLGLVAGGLELVITTWRAIKPQSPWPGLLHFNPHWLWLKPLTGTAVGMTLATAGALLRRVTRVPAFWPLWLTSFGCLLLALFPYHGQFGALSVVLLAAGAAVQISRWLSDAPARWLTDRATTASVYGLVGVVMVALFLQPVVRDRQASTGLPEAPAGAPNIILIVLDTVRFDAIASLPNFSRLAAEGARFDRAFATSSWTLPSHASMFTGRYPQQVFTRGETPINFETRMPDGPPTIAEVLGKYGYDTGGFAANRIYASRDHGLDRGFAHYEDYHLEPSDLARNTALGRKLVTKFQILSGQPAVADRRDAAQITQDFLEWFDRRDGRPVFAFLNFFDAHEPYVAPPPFRQSETPIDPDIDVFARYSPARVEAFRSAYLDCVRYLDHALGELRTALVERQALESTVIIVTSDHGEHFGRSGLMSHGNGLYRSVLQVPLAIRYPRAVPPSVEAKEPVSLRDLPSTILALAGIADSGIPGQPLIQVGRATPGVGRSPVVSAFIVGSDAPKRAPAFWPITHGAMRSIVVDDFHYIRRGDDREELYDVARDPHEDHDLSERPEFANVMRDLRSRVASVEQGRAQR